MESRASEEEAKLIELVTALLKGTEDGSIQWRERLSPTLGEGASYSYSTRSSIILIKTAGATYLSTGPSIRVSGNSGELILEWDSAAHFAMGTPGQADLRRKLSALVTQIESGARRRVDLLNDVIHEVRRASGEGERD